MANREPGTKIEWTENTQYQTILRLTRTIAFEFNPSTGEHFVSPFISEMLAGNYDERQLSKVMLEDGVLHPDDISKMTVFRDNILAGHCGNDTMLMRLKTLNGEYKWYRMEICISTDEGFGYPVVVGTISDVDEETKLRKKQQWQALYDETTDIYNKRAFYAGTERLLKQYPERQYSLILFDVDRFKMVNALFGLEEGDRILRYIGQAVEQFSQQEETYGRIRDDVFCLCVHRTDEEIRGLLGELKDAVAEYPLSFSISLSFGIYRVKDAAMPVSILCDRAALAQKSIKGSALEDYAFYCSDMGKNLAREQEILGEVRHGIRSGQFQVYYQPKHRISDKSIIGAEALVRWIHPEKGMIPPSEFISLLERNGLITLLDEFVWEDVCRTLKAWSDCGFIPIPVSVNVSRIHLYDPNLCDKFITLAETYNILPSLLEIELTESAYVEYPYLGDLMKALQSRGFSFQMDDFGSGYSSLNMLRSIPVNTLKLDLHFLGFSEEDHSGKIIMESVIQMARRLNIPVIAEGVETEGQAAFLLEAGCDMAQGFYYSRPMPRTEFEQKYFQIQQENI